MRNTIQKGCLGSTLFGVAAVLLLTASPALALTPVDPAKGCPQTLNTAGEYVLTGNLDCSGTFGNGINITASNVILHLAGHTISTHDTPDTHDTPVKCDLTKSIRGIDVPGGNSRVVIEGGTVSGFNDGIVLYSSNSVVKGIKLTGACEFGMAISGQNNRVERSVVTGSGLDGIGIGAASGIVIKGNDISGNFRVGVDISNFANNNAVANNIINGNGVAAGQQGGVAIFNGTHNVIRDNTVNNNFGGILIYSPGNVVEGNNVSGSAGNGIAINAAGPSTLIKDNTVLGSGKDLSDTNPRCGTDVWRDNTFQTAEAGSVLNPACIR